MDAQSEGSGFFIRHKDALYILTSQHVIGNTAPKWGEKEVVKPDLQIFVGAKTYSSDIVACSVLHGLCLLSAEPSMESNQISVFTIKDVAPEINLGKAVTAEGFPFFSDESFSMSGEIAGNFLGGPLLYMAPSIYQVQGMSTEFGMSGGALLDEQRNLVGILSHQKLESDELQTYVIPVHYIFEWLNNLDATGKPKIYVDFLYGGYDSDWLTPSLDLELGHVEYVRLQHYHISSQRNKERRKFFSEISIDKAFYKRLSEILNYTQGGLSDLYIYGSDLGNHAAGYKNYQSHPTEINSFLYMLEKQKVIAVGKDDDFAPRMELLSFSDSLRNLDFMIKSHKQNIPIFMNYLEYFDSKEFFNIIEGFAAYSACVSNIQDILLPDEIPQEEKSYILEHGLLKSVKAAHEQLRTHQKYVYCDLLP